MSKRSRHDAPKNEAPSRGRVILYSLAGLFCLCGLADATYLTVMALTGETAACSGQAGCFEVLGSAYSKVAGIPVAAFGVAGYFTAFTFAIFCVFNYPRARKFFALNQHDAQSAGRATGSANRPGRSAADDRDIENLHFVSVSKNKRIVKAISLVRFRRKLIRS